MASLTSSLLFGSPISVSSYSTGSSPIPSSSRSNHPSLQVSCQLSASGLPEQRADNVPRRSFAVGAVLGLLIESHSLQEAHAAARKKPAEAPEKKPDEDRALSSYDAKLLATYKRKQALKEAMAKQKERAASTTKPPAVKPMPAAAPKPAVPEEPTKPEPETTAAAVASSASEAVKQAVETVLPSSEQTQ